MSEAIEILVPEHAVAQVKKAIGPLPAVWFGTHRSNRTACRLVVSPLEAVCTVEGRAGVMRVAGTSRDPLVFLGFFVGAVVGIRLIEAFGLFAAKSKTSPYIAPDRDSVRRMIFARKVGAEKELIASASVEDGQLIVWSCEPKRYEVPVRSIPALARLRTAERLRVTRSGSRIHWDAGDVDVDLETIRELADPDVLRAHEAKRRLDAARYGRAIRVVRESHGLTQSEIPGLSERQVRRLEDGDVVPHAATLAKLAAAHGLDVEKYMQALAVQSKRSRRKRK
jgi:hypothetical protein